jgi:hypothetical protein
VLRETVGASSLVIPDGRVYFIQAKLGGPVKIGFALDPRRRMRELQTANPFPLALVAYVAGDTTLERELHERLDELRAHGEWFHPSDEIEEEINRLLAERYGERLRKLETTNLPSPKRLQRHFDQSLREYARERLGEIEDRLANKRRSIFAGFIPKDAIPWMFVAIGEPSSRSPVTHAPSRSSIRLRREPSASVSMPSLTVPCRSCGARVRPGHELLHPLRSLPQR